MIRKISIAITIIVLAILQTSFLNLFDSSIAYLNLIVLFLVFLVFSLDLIPLLWWSLATGIVLELFSIFPYGLTATIVLLTAVGLQFLFKNFLTNRSIYTFVLLVVAGTAIYNLLLFLSSFLLFSLNVTDFNFLSGQLFWTGLIYQTLFNLCTAWVLFFISQFLSNRLKKRFLLSK